MSLRDRPNHSFDPAFREPVRFLALRATRDPDLLLGMLDREADLRLIRTADKALHYVLADNLGEFRKANPDHTLGRPCVYVGMTGLDPDLRFDKHKAGIQSNRFVFKYGLRLLPELYAVYNPMPYEAAREMEVELAIGLREAGYGVWQA